MPSAPADARCSFCGLVLLKGFCLTKIFVSICFRCLRKDKKMSPVVPALFTNRRSLRRSSPGGRREILSQVWSLAFQQRGGFVGGRSGPDGGRDEAYFLFSGRCRFVQYRPFGRAGRQSLP